MKILKQNKGITLIALVLTIIVLLILAGITINLTIGQDGIITRAQRAGQTYKEAEANEIASLSSFEASVIPGKVAKIVDGVQYVGDGRGNLIPIPVGFSYLEGTKSTGFVIKNNTDENEFVWVPVKGMSYSYERVAWSRDGWDALQTLDQITGEITRADISNGAFTETLPIDEKTSVETYGGYYIGRYEAGIVGGTKEDKKTDGTYYTGDNMKLVVKPGQQVWNYIEKDRALEEATNLYNKENNNVKSKLCSSYAWDTALKFIQTQNSTYPTDGYGGNYSLASGGTGALQNTGYYAVNNIFDIGGNVREWTTESFTDSTASSVTCGGNYTGSSTVSPAADRYYRSSSNCSQGIGFRISLFM